MATPTTPQVDPLQAFVEEPAPIAQQTAAPVAAATPSVDPLLEHVQEDLNEEKYGGIGEQLKTFGEGAANALTFGAAPWLEETFGGAKAADIAGRRETNPVTHMAGQGAGLLGSAGLGELGAASLLSKAGQQGAKAIGLGAEASIAEAGALAKAAGASQEAIRAAQTAAAAQYSTVAKVGSKAAQSAIENMLFQATDETSKALSGMMPKDPGEAAESVAVNLGLSGIIGGAFGTALGVVSPLWEAAAGTKTGSILKSIVDKAGGIEGDGAAAIDAAVQGAGITEFDPVIRAGLMDDPALQTEFRGLLQSDTTKSGLETQKRFKAFQTKIEDGLAQSLGHESGESISNLKQLDKAETGKSIGETLAKEYNAQVEPLSKEFDAVREKYGKIELRPPQSKLDPDLQRVQVPGTVDEIINQLDTMAAEQGWTTSPSSDIMKSLRTIKEELPLQKNVRDLNHYVSEIGNNTQKDFNNGPLVRAGAMMKEVLDDAVESIIGERIGTAEGAEAAARYQQVRAAYKAQTDLRKALNDRLHIGKTNTSRFGKDIKQMAGEDAEKLLNRISNRNDAHLLETLQAKFPETAAAVKQYQIDRLLELAATKAKGTNNISTTALRKEIDGLSPQMKNFLFTPDQLSRIDSVGTVLDHIEEMGKKYNHSNTARTVDKLFNELPGGAIGLAVGFGTGSGTAALVAASLAKTLGKDIPDAIRYSLLKFLGSAKNVDAGGFKAMVDYVQAASAGRNLTGAAVKNVFKAGKEVLPQSAMPKQKDRDRLDKTLKDLQSNSNPLFEVGGKTSHYMPEQGEALGQFSANIVNYLNSARPITQKQSPLDNETKVTSAQKQEFDNLLNIAQQPLVVMNKMKQGRLTSKDVQAVQNMYPALYGQLVNKLTDQMTDTLSKGKRIPFKLKSQMSMFMAQPLDSSFTAQGILGAQPKGQQHGDQMPEPGNQAPSAASTKNLGKSNSLYNTPAQASAQRRASRTN